MTKPITQPIAPSVASAPSHRFAAPPPPPHRFAAPQPPPPADASAPPDPHFVRDEPKPSRVVNAYDHERSTWGIGDFVASLGIYFTVGLGLVLLIFAISGTSDLPHGPWMVLAVVGPQASQFLHLRWLSRRKGTGLANDFQLRFAPSDVRLGLGLFLAAMAAAAFAAYAVTAIRGEAPVSSAMSFAEESSGASVTIWIMLFALLGSTFIPLAEELVFRGLLWSALEKRGMRPGTILVVTSAVFAGVHLEPWRTPVLFMLGLALGYGRLRTGRIGASLVVHCSINASAMLATLITLS